ncbi:MAG: class I SAM-dependent methyltransferase [Patescibacteria group bacterium]|jgi:hypothetical protein
MYKNNYKEINKCRLNNSNNLISILNLGHQCLTGVFPKSKDENISSVPLELVWCPDSGLVQMKHSFNPDEMYGDNYGYRSGLNYSMVNHLKNKVLFLQKNIGLNSGDVVLDIGSNDGTLLKSYNVKGIERIGVDPTAIKFKEYYPDDIILISNFFSKEIIENITNKKIKIITSIAMFYDLEDPIKFVRDIYSILDDDGIWHFEQSYMPSMLRTTSYDTICHEHVEYYSLSVIKYILECADMKIIDVNMNGINGGSFAVTAAKTKSNFIPNSPIINWLLFQENKMGLNTPRPYRDFEERVFKHKYDLKQLITSLVNSGKKVFGYGASTKGNVLLQFCGFTSAEIPFIADVNNYKFGRFTPGSNIPIISEQEARDMKPDFFLVLPWHFKDGILKREKEFIENGGKFIFPFPEIEII